MKTRAEATAYEETSLHAHVMEFLAGLAARNDKRFSLSSFGTSPQGRDLPLVVMSGQGVNTPAEARAKQLPVVLIINGIHAGEVEGKEASQMLMRDILDGMRAELIEKLVLVIVPLFNPDGNDAVDANNRKLDLPRLEGQIGPKLVGTRVNGIGVNLNRDYMKQEAHEMRLLQSKVVQVWEPELTIDNHATNGSVHRFEMTYDVPHTIDSGRAEPIEYMRHTVMPAVQRALAEKHHTLAGWYGNFVEDERSLDARRDADPAAPVSEGWMTYPHNPRFGGNYRGLSNRLDLLLECYSYLTFERRVQVTYATMLETLRYVAAHPQDVVDVVAASRAPRDRIAVRYTLEAFAEPIEIPTYRPRSLDGTPTSVKIKHFSNFRGAVVVQRPPAYIVPQAVADHLARHGVASAAISGEHEVEVATVTGFATEGGRKILEASEVGDLEVSWKRERRAVPAGARLVRTDHASGAIVVYLCEPESDDGAVENGVLAAPKAGEEFAIWRAVG
jgi:Zinc carboxypeptidase